MVVIFFTVVGTIGFVSLIGLMIARFLIDKKNNTMEEMILLPKRLTAENDAKSLLIGEFKQVVEIPNPDYCGCEDCHLCINEDGLEETISVNVIIEWDIIKDIYSKIVSNYSKSNNQ